MIRKTILLDLDGTLLPMDIDDFLNGYFKMLTKEFADIFKPEKFIDNLMYATKQMINNKGDKINSEVFIEEFFNLYQVDNQEEVLSRFDSFYQEKFPLLKSEVEHRGLSRKLIDILKKKDCQLVLATNPIFPLSAIEERLKWVDIDPEDFSLITNYQNMHYCKPDINYYKEITDKLKVDANDCIMIGNDIQEDMVAGRLGMKTYLITDYLIDRNQDGYKYDWKGSLQDLVTFFEKI